jgi:hypothetical protein
MMTATGTASCRVLLVGAGASARAVRGTVEASLERAGWPWSRRLSLWLDTLVTLEEQT